MYDHWGIHPDDHADKPHFLFSEPIFYRAIIVTVLSVVVFRGLDRWPSLALGAYRSLHNENIKIAQELVAA